MMWNMLKKIIEHIFLTALGVLIIGIVLGALMIILREVG
jgi:hypothetical protein